jgi:hypothetical protein
MFDLRLQRAQHSRRYSIVSAAPSGWLVSLEEDLNLRRRDCYHDWHRVERALALFRLEVMNLKENGWEVVPGDVSR